MRRFSLPAPATFLMLLGVLVIVGIGATIFQIREAMEAKRQEIVGIGNTIVQHIDHDLASHGFNVMAMRNLAEDYLSGQVRRSGNPVQGLRFVPGRGGFAPMPEKPQDLGRMVGLGPVPAPDAPVVEEMRMAAGLTPLMRAIRARSPDTPWVYYTSRRGFMYLFPAAEADDFYFKPELLDMEFIAGAGPRANPARKAFWTKPYIDEAGKGLMATVSYPIYRGDEFMGSVSIDVAVSNLQYILDLHPLSHAGVVLRSLDGQQLALGGQRQEPGEAGAYGTVRLQLTQAPWFIELNVSQGDLLREAMRSRAPQIGAIAVLFITLVYSVLLTRSARRVREMAIRDGLTGLYNRRYFDESMRIHFESARRGLVRLGFILLDVDFFKKYNDAYGHQRGDEVLNRVARTLQGTLQRASDLMFRVGGEEFAIVVFLQPDEPLEALLVKLNQAIRNLRLPHRDAPLGYLTISLGATVVDQSRWQNLDAAYRRADEALYRAKGGGRDCFSMADPAEASREGTL